MLMPIFEGFLRPLLRITRKNKRPAFLRALVLYGAGTRSRTRDLLITSQLLYQLSYTGVVGADYRDLISRVKP
jgi:hypothetical protein